VTEIDDLGPWNTGLVANVERLVDAADKHILPALPTLRLKDAEDRPFTLITAAIAERQISALRGATILARHGIGHLTLPLTRPACEERIWLDYLFSLDPPRMRDAVVRVMVSLESSHLIGAQQQYMGGKQMRKLGFPKSFVNGQAAAGRSAKTILGVIGQQLAWDADTGRVPSTGWVAAKVGQSKLYDFLYSATSRGVHFSPTEYTRSGWTVTLDGPVEFLGDNFVNYREMFGLYWLCALFGETIALMVRNGFFGEDFPSADALSELMAPTKAIQALGQVPIALPHEFNLGMDSRA